MLDLLRPHVVHEIALIIFCPCCFAKVLNSLVREGRRPPRVKIMGVTRAELNFAQ